MSAQVKKDTDDLPIYDWNKLLRNQPKGTKTCVDGSKLCSLPETQQKGAIALELDDKVNTKLMANAFKQKRYDFEVVTTGDNDKSIDCAHDGIPLAVTIKYYVKR